MFKSIDYLTNSMQNFQLIQYSTWESYYIQGPTTKTLTVLSFLILSMIWWWFGTKTKKGSQIYLPLNTVKSEDETSNMEVDQSEVTEFDQSEAREIKYEESEGEEGDIKTITNKGSFYSEDTNAFLISPNRWTKYFSELKSCHIMIWSYSKGSKRKMESYLSLQTTYVTWLRAF